MFINADQICDPVSHIWQCSLTQRAPFLHAKYYHKPKPLSRLNFFSFPPPHTHKYAVCVWLRASIFQPAVRQPSVKVRVQNDQQQETSHQDRPRQPCTKLPQQITDLRPSAAIPDCGGFAEGWISVAESK